MKGIAETIYILRLALSKRSLNDAECKVLSSLDFTQIALVAKLHYIEPVVASILQEIGIRDKRERHCSKFQNDDVIAADTEEVSLRCNAERSGEMSFSENGDDNEQKATIQEIMSEFSTNKRRTLLFSSEIANIQQAISAAGIWSCPVKGTAIMNLYPRADMRSMLDIDMIYDAEKQIELQRVLESVGYKAIEIGKHRHDIYEKAPLFELEMHRAAFYDLPRDNQGNLFPSDIPERRLQDEETDINGNVLLFDTSWKKSKENGEPGELTNEGTYLYNMRHIYNDYIYYGTGLRSCMDCAVCLQAWGNILDWSFIVEHAQAEGYADFLATFQSLSQKLLLVDDEALDGGIERARKDIDTLDEAEKKILLRCLRSGQKGNLESKIDYALESFSGGSAPGKLARVKYIASRIFVPKRFLDDRYPRAASIVPLRPVLWCLRFVDSMRNRGSSNLDELKKVFRR